VRIPRFADQAFAAMTTVGMEVYVYDDYFLTRAPGTSSLHARTALFSRPASRFFERQDLFSQNLSARIFGGFSMDSYIAPQSPAPLSPLFAVHTATISGSYLNSI
jgi:hypothetical protein